MTKLDHTKAETSGFGTTVPSGAVQLYLFAPGEAAGSLGVQGVQGRPVELFSIETIGQLSREHLVGAHAAIIQLNPDDRSGIEAFRRLAAESDAPLLAAAYEPPLAFVRELHRAGAFDVIPLPLDVDDLKRSLEGLRDAFPERHRHADSDARLIATIRSEGGIGATALTTQLAMREAGAGAAHGRETCLIDFDLQFGDAAFHLGLVPKLTINDLISAGSRADGDLLRTIAQQHQSGLHVIAAPKDIMPLETLTPDLALSIVRLAMREYGTVFIDLPANWTDWSLSLLARANMALLLTELNVSSLSRAKRQIDLMRSQDMNALDVQIIVNRFEKRLFKFVDAGDLERVLGQPANFFLHREDETMDEAIEQGVSLRDIRRRSALAKDFDKMSETLRNRLFGEE